MNTAPQDDFSGDMARDLGGWSNDALLKELSRRTTITTDADHELVSTGSGILLQHRRDFKSTIANLSYDASSLKVTAELDFSYGYIAERDLGTYKTDTMTGVSWAWTLPDVDGTVVDGSYTFAICIPRFASTISELGLNARWSPAVFPAGYEPTPADATTTSYKVPGTYNTAGWPDYPFEGTLNTMWYPVAYFTVYVLSGNVAIDDSLNKQWLGKYREAPQGLWNVSSIAPSYGNASFTYYGTESSSGISITPTDDYDGSLWAYYRSSDDTIQLGIDSDVSSVSSEDKRKVADVKLDGNIVVEFIDYGYTRPTLGGDKGMVLAKITSHSAGDLTCTADIWKGKYYSDTVTPTINANTTSATCQVIGLSSDQALAVGKIFHARSIGGGEYEIIPATWQ